MIGVGEDLYWIYFCEILEYKEKNLKVWRVVVLNFFVIFDVENDGLMVVKC